MSDVLTPEQRRFCMSRIKGRDTKPERAVYRIVVRMGLRASTVRSKLPGNPDITLRGLPGCIFVHGCFWHRHRCSNGRVIPRTRRAFWLRKFAQNTVRDRRVRRRLNRAGWTVVTIWECQVGRPDFVARRILAGVERARARQDVGSVRRWYGGLADGRA